MKILMLTDKMGIGGAETHIFALSKELIKKGHSITLISAGGVFADKLCEIGAICISAPMDRRDLKSILICRRVLKNEMANFDIIHAHTRFTATLACLIRGRGRLPKIITTAHLPFSRQGIGKLTKWGDHTLAVSNDIKAHLISVYGLPENRVTVTKNGIDLDSFSPDARVPENIIMHISRIDEGRAKTAFLLVDIADRLTACDSALKIVIVGDGDRFDQLRRAAEKKNRLAGREIIILTGAASNVEELLSRAKIFVGVRRALLEAMAMGIPSIASGDEGYGGIITNEAIGILRRSNFCARGLKSAGSEILFSDIFRLLNDEALMKKSSADGLRLVRQSYSSESFANDADACYHKLMRERSAALLGYFGFNNLGDEAICSAAAEALKKRGIGRLAILINKGRMPSSETAQENSITAVNRTNIFKIIPAIKNTDMLILPGGNLLQNETSQRSLLYYTSVMMIARILGRRIYMLSSGIGSIRGALSRGITASAIRKCFFVGARTTADLAVIRAFRGNKNTALMPDICFLLYKSEALRKRNGLYTYSEGRNIGYFAVIASSGFAPSPHTLVALEEYTGLLSRVFIISPMNDIDALRFYKTNGIDVIIPSSTDDFAAKLGECRFSVSSRFHGGIFSLILGVPCFLLSASEKNRALISEIEGLNRDGLLMPLYADDLESIANAKLPDAENPKNESRTYELMALMKKAADGDMLFHEKADRIVSSLKETVITCIDELFGREL